MRLSSLVLLGSLLLPSALAQAHVSIVSGPATASTTLKVTFGVGHGCEDDNDNHFDTIKMAVTIPAEITAVRPMFSDFGRPEVAAAAGVVTTVTWTKPAGDQFADGDPAYYEVTLRLRTPATPFTEIPFTVTQSCTGNKTVVWGVGENPAATLVVTPQHTSGWNQITVPRALTKEELAKYFGDAQIVWRGTEGFSTNRATVDQIRATAGVTELAALAANDQIWVKY